MVRSTPEWGPKPDDTPIPPRVKVRIAKRANYTCQECGIRAVPGHADHIQALINGGENRESNLQWICVPCHKRKTKADLATKSRAAKRQKRMALPKEPKMKVGRGMDGRPRRWTKELGWHDVTN